jgi:hypothetical protein
MNLSAVGYIFPVIPGGLWVQTELGILFQRPGEKSGETKQSFENQGEYSQAQSEEKTLFFE